MKIYMVESNDSLLDKNTLRSRVRFVYKWRTMVSELHKSIQEEKLKGHSNEEHSTLIYILLYIYMF
jgi:hypothetical protein